MRVSVIVPCYNEAEGIPKLIESLDGSAVRLRNAGHEHEVIIVDDGSRDASWRKLREAVSTRPWLRLVRLRRNFGQTAAMAAGIRIASGEVIVPMDADLQNDPADIPRLLEKLGRNFDVVSGWRRKRRDPFLSRVLPSKIANWLVARVGGLALHDYGCTLKAYRREVVEDLPLHGEMHRLIPLFAHWQGARVTELEVAHHPRRTGQSKYGPSRTFNVLLDLLAIRFLGGFSTKPLYFFGKWGLALCGAGTVAATITLYEKYLAAESVWVHRNPLFGVSVFLFMLGVQAIMLGLLAELQVRNTRELSGKPSYVIGESINLASASGEDEKTGWALRRPDGLPVRPEKDLTGL